MFKDFEKKITELKSHENIELTKDKIREELTAVDKKGVIEIMLAISIKDIITIKN